MKAVRREGVLLLGGRLRIRRSRALAQPTATRIAIARRRLIQGPRRWMPPARNLGSRVAQPGQACRCLFWRVFLDSSLHGSNGAAATIEGDSHAPLHGRAQLPARAVLLAVEREHGPLLRNRRVNPPTIVAATGATAPAHRRPTARLMAARAPQPTPMSGRRRWAS